MNQNISSIIDYSVYDVNRKATFCKKDSKFRGGYQLNYSKYSIEQLVERITDLEMLNKELLKEKNQESRLDFSWSGNLGNWYWNIKTNSVTFNPLKITTLGYTMDELPRKVEYSFFTDKLHPDDYQNTMDAMLQHMYGKESVYEAEYRIQAKDKSWKWFYDRGKITQRGVNGKPEFVSGIVFDITARKEQELDLKKSNELIFNDITYIDELTGFANKRTFKLQAEELIKDDRQRFVFIVLDIDKFKLINDLFGYESGDIILKYIANILSKYINQNETFARITGDQFYILFEYESKEKTEARLTEIIKEILTFKFPGQAHFNLVVSAGIFIIKNSEMTIDMISDRARLAAQRIKGSYSSSHFFYNDGLRNQIINENEIENEMHGALENGDFKVHIQPKYDFKTGKIAGAEALIRWYHPIKGIILPALFIPIFEKNGFVTKIDMFVLEEICKIQKVWTAENRKPMIISVNQSRLHLYNINYVEELNSIIKKYDVDPGVIELELTESVFSSNMSVVFDITRRLHNIGFRLSIDDFGSGFSSLNMLKDIFVDVVKIDREFFREPSDSLRSKKIISNIIILTKELGIETVAEGVETKEQVDFLTDIGCDLAQGYYYAKPMPMSEFEDLLNDEKNIGQNI